MVTELRGQWKAWQPGDPVTVNRIVWDQSEVLQLQDVLDADWFGPGQKVEKFARLFGNYVGARYCQPVNSGSSALTLAVESMIELGHWRRGDYILHPILTFPTSIAPAIRAGLIPVFVDVDLNTYQIDPAQAEKAMAAHGGIIEGAIIPHLLGNVCDLDYLFDLLDGRMLIEDCCDTLGSIYEGKHVGRFGEVAAFSFYGSHHITTGGVGGALVTYREDIYDYARSATHWGRTDYSKLASRYSQFEKRYWYDTLGHDFQMTELQAAFGIVQLARVAKANERRAARWQQLDEFFRDLGYDQFFHMPQVGSPKAAPSWFGYPLTIRREAPFSRWQFATHLMGGKIEIRPIFTGNILKHPAFARLTDEGRALRLGATDNADLIGENGLFLPAWGMSEEAMAYMLEVLDKFLERYS